MTKKIPLTQGQFALVDDEDYEWLSQWKWNASYDPKMRSYYAHRTDRSTGKKITIHMHRLIMNTPPSMECDHINHDTLDNRKSQLRNVTHMENLANQRIRADNLSGVPGVTWHIRDKIWQAHVCVNYKKIYLGQFVDFNDAVKARKEYELEHRTRRHGMRRIKDV